MKEIGLRPLKGEDATRMLEWMHDSGVTAYLALDGAGATLESVSRFIQAAADASKNLHRAIVDENDTYLGTVSLKNIQQGVQAEYAIAVHPSAIGTGAAREATAQLLAYAFTQLGLKRVYLCVREDNRRAVRFYEKCGLTFTHTTQDVIRGERTTLRWYEALYPAAE